MNKKSKMYKIDREKINEILEPKDNLEFVEKAKECDVLIYHLNHSNIEHIKYVVKTLNAQKLDKEIMLVLITNYMTWSRTSPKYKKEAVEGEEEGEGEGEGEPAEPEEEEEEEVEEEAPEEEEEELDEEGNPIPKEPKKKVLPFKDTDYHLRVPHPDYIQFKSLEVYAT